MVPENSGEIQCGALKGTGWAGALIDGLDLRLNLALFLTDGWDGVGKGGVEGGRGERGLGMV